MRDLLVITPTRFRRDSALRLADAVYLTADAQTDLILAVDDDDDSYDGIVLPPRTIRARGPRMTCIEWTNAIAGTYTGQYRALASFGDDHEPETPGWDARLLAAIEATGGPGIAYGDDTAQHEALPTAPVISSGIPAALGWLMYPELAHFYADNVWKDLGEAAGCLTYDPDVIIRHRHWSFGTAPPDATYEDATPAWAADEAAYRAWRAAPDGLGADVRRILELRAVPVR